MKSSSASGGDGGGEGGGGADINRRWERKVNMNEEMRENLKKMEEVWGQSGGFLGFFPHASLYVKNHKMYKNEEEKKDEKKEVFEEEQLGEEEENDDADDSADKQLSYFHSFWISSETQKIIAQENRISEPWKWLFEGESECRHLCADLNEFEKQIKNLTKTKNDVAKLTGSIDASCHAQLKTKNIIQDTLKSIDDRLFYLKGYKKLEEEMTAIEKHGVPDAQKLSLLLNEIDSAIHFLHTHFDYLQSDYSRRHYEALRLNGCKIIRNIITSVIENCERFIQQKTKSVHTPSSSLSSSPTSYPKPSEQKGGGGIEEASNVDEKKEEKFNENVKKEINTSHDNPAHIDFGLFHTKFRASGEKVKPYASLLHERVLANTHDVYLHALTQLEGIFAAARIRLLAKPLQDYMHSILVNHTSLALASRHLTTIILSVGQMEIAVFNSFFLPRPSRESIKTVLENLGGVYYEILRPAVLACDDVDELREVACSLSWDVLEPQSQSKKQAELAPLLSIIFVLHSDVQERLIYRTETFIRDDIRGFSPTPYDLDYPNRLLDNNTEENNADKVYIQKAMVGWYVPIEKALICLSKIYKVISNESFECLAQEIVCTSIQSLLHAASLMHQQKGDLDAHLFLIKHLLILREQLSCYDCDLVLKEKLFNFSSIRNRVWGLLSTPSNVFQTNYINHFNLNNLNYLFKFFTPEITENRTDAKKCLEMAIKEQCEQFVAHSDAKVSLPLLKLIHEISASVPEIFSQNFNKRDTSQIFSNSNGIIQKLQMTTCMNHEKLREVFDDYEKNLAEVLPEILQKLILYLLGPSQLIDARVVQKTLFVDSRGNSFENLASPSGIGNEEGVCNSPPSTQLLSNNNNINNIINNNINNSNNNNNNKRLTDASPLSMNKDEEKLKKEKRRLSSSSSASFSSVGMYDPSNSVTILFKPTILSVLEHAKQVERVLVDILGYDEGMCASLHWKKVDDLQTEICRIIKENSVYHSCKENTHATLPDENTTKKNEEEEEKNKRKERMEEKDKIVEEKEELKNKKNEECIEKEEEKRETVKEENIHANYNSNDMVSNFNNDCGGSNDANI